MMNVYQKTVVGCYAGNIVCAVPTDLVYATCKLPFTAREQLEVETSGMTQ